MHGSVGDGTGQIMPRTCPPIRDHGREIIPEPDARQPNRLRRMIRQTADRILRAEQPTRQLQDQGLVRLRQAHDTHKNPQREWCGDLGREVERGFPAGDAVHDFMRPIRDPSLVFGDGGGKKPWLGDGAIGAVVGFVHVRDAAHDLPTARDLPQMRIDSPGGQDRPRPSGEGCAAPFRRRQRGVARDGPERFDIRAIQPINRCIRTQQAKRCLLLRVVGLIHGRDNCQRCVAELPTARAQAHATGRFAKSVFSRNP